MQRTVLSFILALAALCPASVSARPDDDLGPRLAATLAGRGHAATLVAALEALAEDPGSVVAWQYKAFALQGLGRLDEARLAYEETVARDPRNGWAWGNLGDVQASLGRGEEAVRSGRKAVELTPDSLDAHARLSWIFRRRRSYEDAIVAVHRASVLGIDPGWCHAELAYLYWVIGDRRESRKHWELARRHGHDEEACDHGIAVLDWEAQSSSAGGRSRREDEIDRRQGAGSEWVFSVGKIEVHTRIGGKLPKGLAALIAGIQTDQEKILGIRGEWPETVRLWLSRTLEEHEVYRLRHNPLGAVDKGFLLSSGFGGGGGGGFRSGGPRWDLDLYVALAEPGLTRSLSHELAHAMLHVRVPNCRDLPVWFDEGVATLLELAPDPADRRGRLVPGTARKDYLEVIEGARESGRLLDFPGLMRTERSEYYGELGRVRYAQAWSMMHYLVNGSGREGERRFQALLDISNEFGRGWHQGFREIYGSDFKAMDEGWRAHLEGLKGN